MDINIKLYEELHPNDELTLSKLGDRLAAIAEKINKLKDAYGDQPIEFWVDIDWKSALNDYPKERETMEKWSANDFVLHIEFEL